VPFRISFFDQQERSLELVVAYDGGRMKFGESQLPLIYKIIGEYATMHIASPEMSVKMASCPQIWKRNRTRKRMVSVSSPAIVFRNEHNPGELGTPHFLLYLFGVHQAIPSTLP
jgi:hypothetical protein